MSSLQEVVTQVHNVLGSSSEEAASDQLNHTPDDIHKTTSLCDIPDELDRWHDEQLRTIQALYGHDIQHQSAVISLCTAVGTCLSAAVWKINLLKRWAEGTLSWADICREAQLSNLSLKGERHLLNKALYDILCAFKHFEKCQNQDNSQNQGNSTELMTSKDLESQKLADDPMTLRYLGRVFMIARCPIRLAYSPLNEPEWLNYWEDFSRSTKLQGFVFDNPRTKVQPGIWTGCSLCGYSEAHHCHDTNIGGAVSLSAGDFLGRGSLRNMSRIGKTNNYDDLDMYV